MEITIKPAYQELEAIQALLSEYAATVVAGEPEYADYLRIQRFETELNHPEKKYGEPDGRLYLAQVNGEAAGCIAMKRLDETRCEMKRLYIRPAFRGRGIARHLVELLLAEAQRDGYEAMVLDTFPFLGHAVQLYRDMGFYEIPGYTPSPIDPTIYMCKDLRPS